MNWVCVHLALNPGDADLVRSRLEAAGFVVDVAGELPALSTAGGVNAVGGIKISVPKEVAEDARALLDADH
jgi:hypothetical protein